MQGEYALRDIRYEVVTQVFEPRVNNGEVEDYQKQGTNISFTVTDADKSCYVLLPLQNYKGYQVTSEDGSITNKNLSTGPAAVMRIDIPEGYRGNIEVRYRGLWYWRVAEFISVVCLVFVVIMFCRDKRKKPS